MSAPADLLGAVAGLLARRTGWDAFTLVAEPSVRLMEDLGLQSIDAAELLYDCEELFGVDVEIESFDEITTVESLVELMARATAAVDDGGGMTAPMLA